MLERVATLALGTSAHETDPVSPARARKTRVAIVGGGPSALAAAFELTADGRADHYEVTIYQQGWRLGGKCASGRMPTEGGQRIEEHGLHVFFGCYANTREVVDRCLTELRASAKPYAFASFDEAFESVDTIVLGQRAGEQWDLVELEFPRNPLVPSNFGDFVAEALRWVAHRVEQLLQREGLAGAPDPEQRWSAVAPILRELNLDEPDVDARVGQVARGMSRLHRELTAIFLDVALAAQAKRDPDDLVEVLQRLVDAALPDRSKGSADVRFFLETVELLCAVLRGVWRDDVLDCGFDAINDVDLAAWLSRHGLELSGQPLEWPALLRAVYDGCFAFEKGDPEQPRMAAGRALQGAIRCLFHYEGSVLYRPRSSMSDAVIGPLARVLEERGVDIRYFHAVEKVRVAGDGSRIEGIDVIEQVPRRRGGLRAAHDRRLPGRAAAAVGTVRTWPSLPPPDLIPPGAAGPAPGAVLEQQIDPFGGAKISIDANDDEHGFDWLILAVPPEVQRSICPGLISADPPYAQMLDASHSVVTQAAQIWLGRTAEELGQRFSSASLLSCFVEPLDTYADMGHIISVERWPASAGVRHVAYFCGVLPQAGLDTQELADRAARTELARFLNRDAGHLWPEARANGRFDWDVLVPRGEPPGDPRDRPYVRANWAPTERYVLTLPDTVRHRLRADATRFNNLVLAGDWTANGFDAGCLEAAITSGRLAARAIAGAPALDAIPGVNGPPGFPNRIDGNPGRRSELGRLESLCDAARSLAGGAFTLAGVGVDAVQARVVDRIPGAASLRGVSRRAP